MGLLTLVCRKGRVLILDEPEFGLYGMEIQNIRKILALFNETFEEIYIVTHCQWLFGIADEYAWMRDYNMHKISEEELNEYIGTV